MVAQKIDQKLDDNQALKLVSLDRESLASGARPTTKLLENSDLIKTLTRGKRTKPYTQEERENLERESQKRTLQWDKKLSENCYTEAEVAKRLKATSTNLQERVENQSLLAISYEEGLIFPKWQFDPNNHQEGEQGLVKGLREVLEALDLSVRAQISWLTKPHPIFEQRSPIEILKQGDKNRVLQEARWVGIS